MINGFQQIMTNVGEFFWGEKPKSKKRKREHNKNADKRARKRHKKSIDNELINVESNVMVLSTGSEVNDTPYFHLRYESRDDFKAQIKKLAYELNIDTLFITGDHGSFADERINKLYERDIKLLCKHLKKKTLKAIVLDCCDSAFFISVFKKYLAKDGVIYSNLSDGVQHRAIELCNNYQANKRFTLGEALNFMISQSLNSAIANHLPVFYPSVYTRRNNTLYFYENVRPLVNSIYVDKKTNKQLIEGLETQDSLIESLEENDINVKEVKNKKKYYSKILEAKTPVKSRNMEL